jgi:hypothetical protein
VEGPQPLPHSVRAENTVTLVGLEQSLHESGEIGERGILAARRIETIGKVQVLEHTTVLRERKMWDLEKQILTVSQLSCAATATRGAVSEEMVKALEFMPTR